MPHLWVRSESRANERRVGLTPDGLRELRIQGFRVTVEDSPHRILPIAAFAEAMMNAVTGYADGRLAHAARLALRVEGT